MHWPHNKQPFLITKGEGRGNGRVCTVNYTFIALPDHKFLPWLHWTELSLSSHSLFSFSCSPLPCFPREMNGKSLEYMGALDLPRFLTLNDFITLAWLLTQTPESASHQQGTPCWTWMHNSLTKCKQNSTITITTLKKKNLTMTKITVREQLNQICYCFLMTFVVKIISDQKIQLRDFEISHYFFFLWSS